MSVPRVEIWMALADELTERLVDLQRLVRMSVTEEDHECRGRCPDEDNPAIRDPDCLACAALDFPAEGTQE